MAENKSSDTLDSKITNLLDILDDIEYHPDDDSSRRLGDSRSSSFHGRDDDIDTALKAGDKLFHLHKAIKLEQLHTKSDLQLLARMDTVQINVRKEVFVSLVDIHSLMKKIELMESNNDTPNIENLLGKESPQYTVESLPKNTHHQIVTILHYLRKNPAYLCESLARMGWLDIDGTTKYHMKLSRILVMCLFRATLCPKDEKVFVRFMKELVKTQFLISKTATGKLQYSPFFYGIFSCYVRFTPVQEFLKMAYDDYLIKIIHDTSVVNNPIELNKLSAEIIDTMIRLSNRTPFGIRFIAAEILSAAKEIGVDMEETYKILQDLLLNFFFLFPFLPTNFLLHTGVSVLREQNIAIQKVGEYILKLLQDPSNEFKFDCKNFFDQMLNVNMESFLNRRDDRLVFVDYIMTKSEFEMILEIMVPLLIPNQEDRYPKLNYRNFRNPEDPLVKILGEFVAEQKQVTSQKTKYHGIHPRILLELRIPRKFKIYANAPSDPFTNKMRKEIHTVLSEVTSLPLYKGCSLEQTLDAICSINEILNGIKELNEHYKKNEFEVLINQMWADHHYRVKDQAARTDDRLLDWEHLQNLQNKVRSQKTLTLDYFTSIKIFHFNLKMFDAIQIKFVDNFTKRFKEDYTCTCCIRESNICDLCRLRSDELKNFMQYVKKTVQGFGLWQNVGEEEIKMALRQTERKIMSSLNEFVFHKIVDDIIVSQEVTHLKSKLTIGEFDIPPKYHSEAPWTFAQTELCKLPNIKGPFDKFLCISRAWEIVSNCVSLIDDPGPDACFPIMSYIIYSVLEDVEIFSNIRYINLFSSTMEDIEDARMLAFRTVAKSLEKFLEQMTKKYQVTESHRHTQVRVSQKNKTLIGGGITSKSPSFGNFVGLSKTIKF